MCRQKTFKYLKQNCLLACSTKMFAILTNLKVCRAYHRHRVYTSQVTYWFHKLDSNNRAAIAAAAQPSLTFGTHTHARTRSFLVFYNFFQLAQAHYDRPSSRHYGVHPSLSKALLSLYRARTHTHTQFWKRVKSLRHEKGRWWCNLS